MATKVEDKKEVKAPKFVPESLTDRQVLAKLVTQYASLDDTSARLKFLQDLVNANKSVVINQLAYIYPNAAKHDVEELVGQLTKLDKKLFTNGVNINLNDKQFGDLSAACYRFVAGFHLLGRSDDKDLFQVHAYWNLLRNQLVIESADDEPVVASRLSKLNSDIDGDSDNKIDVNVVNQDVKKYQAVVDFLTDLASQDDKKLKELRRYKDKFDNGEELVQTLHQQGVYEPVDSIKKRAFVKSVDDDFVHDIQNLDANQVAEKGLFTKNRMMTRQETIDALFNNTLVTKPVLEKYQKLLKQAQQKLASIKARQQQNTKAQASAVKFVRNREQDLIDTLKKQLQADLNQLAKTLINSISLHVKYQK